MKPIISTKKLLPVILFFVLAVVAYYVYGYFSFAVVSTNPSTIRVATWTPFFNITFNQNLSSGGLSVSMSPGDIYGKYYVRGSTLVVPLSVPMQSGKKYIITIGSISDTHGQKISYLRYSFTPINKTIKQLPRDQQEVLIQRNESSPVYKYPLLNHLPYYSVDFNLSASFLTGKNNLPSLLLVAKIFIPAAYTGSLQQQVVNQRKQEVANYVLSFGLKPSDYTIQYVVVSGS